MNSQAFTPDEVKQGLLQDLLNYLLDYNQKNNNGYYDIHITSDGFCTIVEWVDIIYDFQSEESKFVLLKSDECVMKELSFPDNHYEMVYPEEAEERLSEWHKEHPEWVKTPYGTWTNEEENRRLKEKLQTEDTHDCVIPPYEKNEHGDLVEIEEEKDSEKEIYEENGVIQ